MWRIRAFGIRFNFSARRHRHTQSGSFKKYLQHSSTVQVLGQVSDMPANVQVQLQLQLRIAGRQAKSRAPK